MNVKNIVLGVGIFVVFLLMLGYGIEAFYPSPKYDGFCKPNLGGSYPMKAYDYAGTNCTFNKQVQESADKCFGESGYPVYDYDDAGCTVAVKECDYCQKNFDEANNAYSKIVFIISLIVGLIALFVGYRYLSVEPVGSALMASGVGSIFYGSIRNWQNLSDVWRFLLLLIALVFLIWIAMRINKTPKVKKK
ncbi:MAG: hypothetical protein Q7R87_01335 [Nanoarchaeota archaeon]|nr:hypothetical protein [Nanoarchaeota archaeon]